jgi:branched-chain amino acid transport system substrate-binding protein
VLGAAASGALLWAGGEGARAQAQKPSELRSASPPSCPAPASVFGVPARQAAELLIEQINRSGGIGGVPLRAFFVDEGARRGPLGRRVPPPGAERAGSRGLRLHLLRSCLACTPLSTELRKTTLLWDCGTQRIFEEGKHPYAFRTQGYGTPEVLAPLLYLLKTKPDFRTLAVINQDYAWGRDSWELWKAGMDAAALLDAADAVPHQRRREDLPAPGAVAGVVGELHGVDGPDLGAEALQGEHRARVSDVSVGDPGLDGEDVHAALPCRARS